MTEYQPTEQDKVLLDYAQTAQRRADPWAEFEWENVEGSWYPLTGHPAWFSYSVRYRRKPRTVTLKFGGKEWELPASINNAREFISTTDDGAAVFFSDTNTRNQWLAALREIANGEGGQ